MKCGACQQGHPSVADVKACYAGGAKAATAQVALQGPAPATAKQVEFIKSLAEGQEVPVAGRTATEAKLIARVEDVLGGKFVAKSEASQVITWLLALPKKAAAAEEPKAETTVPAGRYAVLVAAGVDDEETATLRFYQVDRPEKGQWAGRVFVSELFGSPGDFRKERRRAAVVLSMIESAPGGWKAAMARFGQEVGECGKCKSPLTDETSRKLGIGPVCRGKVAELV